MEPPDENLEAPEEAPTPSGVLRSVMLFYLLLLWFACAPGKLPYSCSQASCNRILLTQFLKEAASSSTALR